MSSPLFASAQNFVDKCGVAFGVVGQLRNWPAYFADYLRLPGPALIEFRGRGGVRCLLRARSTDRMIFNDIWVRRVYCGASEIRPGDVVIDIGAHIGLFTLFAASRGARVFSFEPFPESFQLLKENIVRNRWEGRVTPFPQAIWNTEGPLNLYVSKKSTGSHSALTATHESVKVEATTLAKLFSEQRIERCRVLKIDAEGAEYPILYSLPPDILARIDRISLEWHDLAGCSQPEYEHTHLKQFLEQNGFTVRARLHLEVLVAERRAASQPPTSSSEDRRLANRPSAA